MPEYLHPGVYVEELSSGGRDIVGAKTSVTAFIGTAPAGPMGKPVNISSHHAFAETFGTDQDQGEMPAQVRQFFMNGGVDAWVVRIEGTGTNSPTPHDYDAAYQALIKEADIFNTLVLPRCRQGGQWQTDAQRAGLWGPASAMCQKQRVFLIMDPPGDEASIWDSALAVETGIIPLRAGIVDRQAALYWPKISIIDEQGEAQIIDPSGTVAGIYARTDAARGVWKAPAGIDAEMIGVRGLSQNITEQDNSVINPVGVNALRQLPQGIMVWGARTLAGFQQSEWRYVPVRRLALMIEESITRGVDFAVFEPNDEPLWAQIRTAIDSFMGGLYREGALMGAKSSDAYFVKCDRTTTTQSDIDNGIVNIQIGFAPLRPAEFVVLTIRQIAGQA